MCFFIRSYTHKYFIIYPLTTETFIHNQSLLKGISDLSTIGSRIQYYRLLKGLTQEELSSLSGLNRTTIIRYENDSIEPLLKNLNKIAIALDINPSIIYDDYFDFLSSDSGNRIKSIRKSLNLTQNSFSALLDVNRKTIIRWEKEEINPTRYNYMKLNEILPYNNIDKDFKTP